MDQYELLCLMRYENEPEGTLPPSLSVVTDAIQKHHGSIVSQDDWGVRRLAYPVDHQTTGHYVLFVIRLEHTAIKPLTSTLALHSVLLRHQLVDYVKPAPRRPLQEPQTTPATQPAPSARVTVPAQPRAPINAEELDKTIDEMLEEKVL